MQPINNNNFTYNQMKVLKKLGLRNTSKTTLGDLSLSKIDKLSDTKISSLQKKYSSDVNSAAKLYYKYAKQKVFSECEFEMTPVNPNEKLATKYKLQFKQSEHLKQNIKNLVSADLLMKRLKDPKAQHALSSDILLKAIRKKIENYMRTNKLGNIKISRKHSNSEYISNSCYFIHNNNAIDHIPISYVAKNNTKKSIKLNNKQKSIKFLGRKARSLPSNLRDQGGVKKIFNSSDNNHIIAKFQSHVPMYNMERFDTFYEVFKDSNLLIGAPVKYKNSKQQDKMCIIAPRLTGSLSIYDGFGKGVPKEQNFSNYLNEVTDEEKLSLVLGLCRQVKTIHDKNWIHGDIHTSNILFSLKSDPLQDNKAVIDQLHLIDFDLSVSLEEANTHRLWLGGRYSQELPEYKRLIAAFDLLKKYNSQDNSLNQLSHDYYSKVLTEGAKPLDVYYLGKVLSRTGFGKQLKDEETKSMFNELLNNMTDNEPVNRPTIDEVIEQVVKISREPQQKNK